MSCSSELIRAAQTLSQAVKDLRFSPPVSVVYNPLEYAWKSHTLYLETYGNTGKKVVFMGMNPGPWGMVQTGVPFGEIDAVKNWLGICAPVDKPNNQHPQRPVEGFQCKRPEISGLRFWGFLKERFGEPGKFFQQHFVSNYCPLAFIETSGRNRTPDKLKPAETRELFAACDQHLREVVQILEPEWLIGIGHFAEKRAGIALEGLDTRTAGILHPSPANPAANRDWAGIVTRQMQDLKIWD